MHFNLDSIRLNGSLQVEFSIPYTIVVRLRHCKKIFVFVLLKRLNSILAKKHYIRFVQNKRCEMPEILLERWCSALLTRTSLGKVDTDGIMSVTGCILKRSHKSQMFLSTSKETFYPLHATLFNMEKKQRRNRSMMAKPLSCTFLMIFIWAASPLKQNHQTQTWRNQ